MKLLIVMLLSPISLTWADPAIHTESICTYEDQFNRVSATFTYALSEDGAQVSSKLTLNDVEIPAQKEFCHEQNVPGRRGYLCTHRTSTGETYDLYPQYEAPQGKLTKASMIIWGETDATTIQFSSCE